MIKLPTKRSASEIEEEDGSAAADSTVCPASLQPEVNPSSAPSRAQANGSADAESAKEGLF